MKRIFILKASTARTDNKFTIKDLPGTSGRLDVVCRCILSSLLLSKGHRLDTIFYAVLEGPPRPPITVEVNGEKIEELPRDELKVALILKELLNPIKTPTIVSGFRLMNRDFQDLVEEKLRESKTYFLHRTGKNIKEILSVFQNFKTPQLTFILGDHIGLNQNEIEYLEGMGIKPISLGPKEYLGSHCISLIQEKLDQVIERKK
ncbi:MAG: tRNA (pseudouridine(54)-N(1))-methyltransferase TrmY [Candidatus Freyarchaeota archaeon]|nr:tRNA (pseudouridine(54)-N(1))-methyltransferase TrmY [Candidatus Jordarchaeia archaeon]MBS7270161.1 tRNA (pseudouridine(54)-N(1))-methyltransferase TrmY [Candidatus Jordarchaeia archaeon]MBS7280212.1 tRNA (pseudouridine(54)-N(1))-methyltransferase TrmY [Candidatus Jordarchaeia archaeon]